MYLLFTVFDQVCYHYSILNQLFNGIFFIDFEQIFYYNIFFVTSTFLNKTRF